MNPDGCSAIADNVASTTVIDPLTVEFVLKQKYAPFISAGLGSTLILPKKAIEESFARFQAAAGAVTLEEVTALSDKVAKETAADNPNCTVAEGATPPASCLFSTYTAELEAMLAKAKIEPVNKAGYNTGGENADQFDPEAYAQGLLRQVDDLKLTLGATRDRPDRRRAEDHRLRQEPDRRRPVQVRQVQRRPERRARAVRRLLRWRDEGRPDQDPGEGVRGRHPQLRRGDGCPGQR